MLKKIFRIFHHSIGMVGRTRKSYIMLSITIVLSFSLLFGYLLYMDSSLYNQYKYVFGKDRNILGLYDPDLENKKIQLVLNQVSDMDNTWYYINYETSGIIWENYEYKLEDGRDILEHGAQVISIPDRVWGLYDSELEPIEITYLDGVEREGITLNSGEALMDETTFCLLGLDKMEEPIYNLSLQKDSYDSDVEPINIQIKIVGTFASLSSSKNRNDTIVETVDENTVWLDYLATIYLSQKDFNIDTYPDFSWQRRIYFYSETPELIDQVTDRISYTYSISSDERTSIGEKYSAIGVYSQQNEAFEKMQTEARTKAIIVAALLLLLGINLYSSFTNALNDRKFEIGVKRAIGASSWEIIRQFLYESILVMMANIVLSIALVTDVFIVYKFIYESIPDEWGNFNQWIIYISPYSIAMFVICSVTLTVVFSLIFAYKSTQVEIVQYLKAE